jgi:hypothetical protein
VKAAFGAEAIGLGASDNVTARMLGMSRELNRMARPWVAEIVGPDDRYGWRRRFLSHKADYRQANGGGTRGVWFWWTLESGRVYEAKYRTTWSLSSIMQRFLTVDDDGEIKDLTEDEVREWMATAASEGR